jgi:hypothetical protein
MTATIFKTAIAEFNLFGVPDGVLYIEGRRGTLSNPAWVGTLAQFPKVDFSSGLQSAGVHFDVLVDTTFSLASIASGNTFTVSYLGLTSAGQFEVGRTDTWTAT